MVVGSVVGPLQRQRSGCGRSIGYAHDLVGEQIFHIVLELRAAHRHRMPLIVGGGRSRIRLLRQRGAGGLALSGDAQHKTAARIRECEGIGVADGGEGSVIRAARVDRRAAGPCAPA